MKVPKHKIEVYQQNYDFKVACVTYKEYLFGLIKIPVRRWLFNSEEQRVAFFTKEILFANIYNQHIKDTVEDEIVGAMGRIFGLMGKEGRYNETSFAECLSALKGDAERPFPQAMYCAITHITNGIGIFNYPLALLTLIAEKEKIDIEWHLEQVLRYNKTRPQKHGCKY